MRFTQTHTDTDTQTHRHTQTHTHTQCDACLTARRLFGFPALDTNNDGYFSKEDIERVINEHKAEQAKIEAKKVRQADTQAASLPT